MAEIRMTVEQTLRHVAARLEFVQPEKDELFDLLLQAAERIEALTAQSQEMMVWARNMDRWAKAMQKISLDPIE